MSDQAVYRTRDADVIAAWTQALDALAAYRTSVQNVLGEHGLLGYQVWSSTGIWDYGRFTGLEIPAEQKCPEGWRMTGSRQYAVPDKRTREGREAWRELERIPHPGNPRSRLPGMPGDAMTGSDSLSGVRLIAPSMRMIGSALYATWPADPAATGDIRRAGRRGEVDLTLWERVRLSEYYAVLEALEDEAVSDRG